MSPEMRTNGFGTFEKRAPYNVSDSNYRFKAMWIWTTFVIVNRLSSPAALVVALLVAYVIALGYGFISCNDFLEKRFFPHRR